jgi:hypothetical protein
MTLSFDLLLYTFYLAGGYDGTVYPSSIYPERADSRSPYLSHRHPRLTVMAQAPTLLLITLQLQNDLVQIS